MIICNDDIRKLDYLTGELEGVDRDEFVRHLASCRGCREELAAMAILEVDLRDLPQVRCPDTLAADTLASLREYSSLRSRYLRYRILALVGLCAAGAALVSLVSLMDPAGWLRIACDSLAESLTTVCRSVPLTGSMLQLAALLLLAISLPRLLDRMSYLLTRKMLLSPK
ncbi:MAG: hypothetical protein GY835_21135 [bacterium]|nr:hypothetical protein [bacterium]